MTYQIFALFWPPRALRCAFGLTDMARDLGIDIRAAIHTCEIEVLEDDVGGIGVHIAARVLAEAGQIVVTRMVRDLATSTDLGFRPFDSVVLRGVPGNGSCLRPRSLEAVRSDSGTHEPREPAGGA